MTPEGRARQKIDAMLAASGWVMQTKGQINLSASRGVAICELSFTTGEPDYTLFVEGKAINGVEAMPEGLPIGEQLPKLLDELDHVLAIDTAIL